MEYWYDEAKEQYIKKMEQIIANHCFTNMESYRYPVHYRKDGKSDRTKGDVMADVSLKDVSSMHYDFGVHRMDIGKALLEIIELLEKHSEDNVFEYYSEDDDDDDIE